MEKVTRVGRRQSVFWGGTLAQVPTPRTFRRTTWSACTNSSRSYAPPPPRNSSPRRCGARFSGSFVPCLRHCQVLEDCFRPRRSLSVVPTATACASQDKHGTSSVTSRQLPIPLACSQPVCKSWFLYPGRTFLLVHQTPANWAWAGLV